MLSRPAVLLVLLASLLAVQEDFQEEIPGSVDVPDQIYLSLTSDPAREMIISWHTAQIEGISRVNFGLTSDLGVTVEGSVQSSPEGGAGFIRSVTLTGLSPATQYFYACGTDLGGWSATFSFRTLPAGPSKLVFAAYGDQGVDEGAPDVVKAVGDANPDLVMLLGDLSYANGGPASIWDDWFKLIEPNARRIPHMSILGNHETDYPRDLSIYLGRFSLPHVERWYAITVSGVRLIALDTSAEVAPESEQHEWLKQELEAASQDSNIRWIIVCSHFPCFTSCAQHPEDADKPRLHLSPLFQQFGVDLVLSGHAHMYERTYPINAAGNVTDAGLNEFFDPSGTVYVVAGGGGHGLHKEFTSSAPPWSAVRGAWYGFAKISLATEDSLKVEYVDFKGSVRDSFTLWKSDPVPGSGSDSGSDSGCGLLGIEPGLALLAIVIFRRKAARRRS
jgi:3',5'-cyclic AMP phosphodiesterase CpdA